jgi:hypothetical protein
MFPFGFVVCIWHNVLWANVIYPWRSQNGSLFTISKREIVWVPMPNLGISFINPLKLNQSFSESRGKLLEVQNNKTTEFSWSASHPN